MPFTRRARVGSRFRKRPSVGRRPPAAVEDRYPYRPTRLVVLFGAGGITDVVGRLMGQHLGEEFAQTIVVENKPEPGGATWAQDAIEAELDDHTLLLMMDRTSS